VRRDIRPAHPAAAPGIAPTGGSAADSRESLVAQWRSSPPTAISAVFRGDDRLVLLAFQVYLALPLQARTITHSELARPGDRRGVCGIRMSRSSASCGLTHGVASNGCRPIDNPSLAVLGAAFCHCSPLTYPVGQTSTVETASVNRADVDCRDPRARDSVVFPSRWTPSPPVR